MSNEATCTMHKQRIELDFLYTGSSIPKPLDRHSSDALTDVIPATIGACPFISEMQLGGAA